MKKYISIILALLLLTGCKAEVGGPGAARPTGESPTPAESVTPDDPAAPEATEPTPVPDLGDLTQEEVDRVNRAFFPHEMVEGVTAAAEVNGFFLSYYANARELDLGEFLSYYPDDGTLTGEDLEEFAALAELPGFHWKKEYFAESGLTPDRLPVPTHRILRSSIDDTLRKYAGITAADLSHTEGTLYLRDYDAYYTFTSDYGPGVFLCEGGSVEGDTAHLWTGELYGEGVRNELTLKRVGENWYIHSFLRGMLDREKSLNAWLLGVETGEVERIEGLAAENRPSIGELVEMLRSAAQTPVSYWQYGETVWNMTLWLTEGGALSIGAGEKQDVVCISRAGEQECFRAPELYQLVRTGMDREEIINEYWYEKCRGLVDGYYDMRLEELREAGYTSWELTEFAGIIGTSKEENRGITVFRVNAAFCTDPPELAAHRIAGGAYVDSRFRAHGLDWYPVHLVVIDGQAVGLTYDDWLERYPGEDPLDHYTAEEIRDMVAGARRSG